MSCKNCAELERKLWKARHIIIGLEANVELLELYMRIWRERSFNAKKELENVVPLKTT